MEEQKLPQARIKITNSVTKQETIITITIEEIDGDREIYRTIDTTNPLLKPSGLCKRGESFKTLKHSIRRVLIKPKFEIMDA